MEGKILQGDPFLRFHSASIDSRLTKPGDLFFAIAAKRDGHDFIPDAIRNGASGAIISHAIPPLDEKLALIHVKETIQALQKLAKNLLAEFNPFVVGITGSAGKTTTKEFTATLLAGKSNVMKSNESFNNHIGLPLSLLELTPQTQIAVLEYGMSSAGEITALTQIAPPHIALITNVLPVHTEFFKSIREIAFAKREILEGMKPNGTALLNGDDQLVTEICRDWTGEKIYFGLSQNCEIRAKNICKQGWKGMSFDLVYSRDTARIALPLVNESHLYNFLAASAVAFKLSYSLQDILSQISQLKLSLNRGNIIHLEQNIKVINDSYNSSPVALEKSLKSLAELPGERKIAVLGDMLELGKKEIDYHIQAGKTVARLGIELLVTVGPLARYMAEGALSSGMAKTKILSFENSTDTAKKISSFLRENDVVLIKGSREKKMERIIPFLNLNYSYE